MMKTKYIILLLVISANLILAGATIKSFSVKSTSGNVVVNWETYSETNLNHFVVERKTLNGVYIEIGVVYPTSSKIYEYVDQSVFKTSGQLYVYRLKIVDNDGSASYSNKNSVANLSSVGKRTWGSIKALFR